jgi:hypothetical protein
VFFAAGTRFRGGGGVRADSRGPQARESSRRSRAVPTPWYTPRPRQAMPKWAAVEPFLVAGRELKARYALEDLWGVS